MTTHGKDWLTARAREGHPASDTYNLAEAYPGERADLVAELRAALVGCEEPERDRLGSAMLAALRLNALPVLRAVVAIWRDAYLGLLTQIEPPSAVAGEASGALSVAEIERLATLKRRIHANTRHHQ